MKISKRAEELFIRAQSHAPESRAKFLEEACGQDKGLLEEVTSLLKAAEDSEEFFDKLSGKVGLSAFADDDLPLPPNKTIGNWRLKHLIGRGGMGAVYLAERADEQFEQQGALKILPFGLDTDVVRSRFLTERQILASLVHDNIARLLDGGVTDEGTPFFVMDYVDGLAIDIYCDQQKLSVRDRIRLFLGVLAAVSHAHAHLIVHRDIKPSNVLVTKEGNVKLLDFGIAKMLSAGAGVQQTRELTTALTPEFAAPEQLVGGPVTTATDVYTLGLLLYTLLAGRNPRNDASTGSAAVRAFATEDPPRLSDFATGPRHANENDVNEVVSRRNTSLGALKRTLKGDLDNIMQKALAVDAVDRYATVADLAADLRRYLDDEPVTAQPITIAYRVNKFVRRHRGGVLVASLTLIALVASTAITAWQMVEAKQQRDIAIYQQQRVQASNEFYGLLMEEVGTEPLTSIELLDRGRALLEKQFGVEAAFMGPVLFEVSRRYGSLGEQDKQLELLRQAELLAREHDDDSLLAAILCRMSEAYRLKDPDKANDYAVDGNKVFGNIRQPTIEASMECLRMKARLAEQEGDRDAVLGYLIAARDTLDAHPAPATNLRGVLLNDIALYYYKSGDLEKSIGYLDETLVLLDSTGRGSSLGYLRVAANKAVTQQSIGRVTEALEAFEDLVTRIRNSGYEQRGAASLLGQYGSMLTSVGRINEAETVLLEGFGVAEAGGDEQSIAAINLGLSKVYLANRKFEQSLERLDAVLAHYQHEKYANRMQSRSAKVMRAKVMRTMGRLDEASVEITALLDEVGYPEATQAEGLLSAIIEAAAVHQQLGNLEYAEELATGLIQRLVDRAVGDPADSVYVGRAYEQRAGIRADSGNAAGAIEDLEKAVPILARVLGEQHREAVTAQESLDRLQSETRL